jgi:methionyl-tRNA synthetase
MSGATPVLRESEHYFFRLGQFRRRCCANGWPATWRAAGQGQAAASGWTAACATGTSRAMRPISASRSRTRRASSSTSGWMRRSAIWRASGDLCDRTGIEDFDSYSRRQRQHRAAPLHRQGHHQLPRPVLAGDAARCGLPHADAPACERLTSRSTAQKMSKSRGTFIQARTYLEHLNPEYLRYYFAAKLGAAWRTSTSISRISRCG